MRCIRPGGAAAEESHRGKPTPCIAGSGHRAAIAALLRLVGSAIRFGPFSVSLVLIPIVLGAALYGWGMGCWLGLVFGAVVLLSGDAGLFLAADPGGAIVTALSKGIACGAAAGLCCRWLHPRYPDFPFCCRLWPPRWSIRGAFLLDCPCTLVIAGGLGRFAAPLCRREAVYNEDLLLRGLWKLCTANCPSADKP